MTEPTADNSHTFFETRSIISRQNRIRSKFTGPTFFIGGYNGGVIVETILTKQGWIKINDKFSEDFNLAWTELATQINYPRLKPLTQLVNHIPNNSILTNKLGLIQSLRKYEKYCLDLEKLKKLQMDDFTPKTFVIDNIEERNDFFATFQEGDIWICKPIGANQGKGISLIRDINKFKVELLDRNMRHANSWIYHSKITQKYITNPLLIEGRKFDIRCYMLIASTIPYLVLYCPGYVRLSLNKYSNNDDNLITHLTNQFVQKQSPNYESLKESTVWSTEQFNDYFNAHYTHLENFKKNWVQMDLADIIKHILVHVFNSIKHRLANSVSYFELYGLDFMVDDNLKVWLIEANSNPSMSTTCSLLREIIPSMIEEALFIALECFEKNTKLNKPLLPLENVKKFHVIFCENFEIAKTRKPNGTVYNNWVTPLQKQKDVSSSRPIALRSAPLTTVDKVGKNDVWNKLSPSDPSMSSTRKSLFQRMYEMNQTSMTTPRLTQSKALSGDSRLRSKSVQANFDRMFARLSNYDSNKISYPTKKLSFNKEIVSTAVSQSKLNEVLRNVN